MSLIKKADVKDYFAKRAGKGVLFFQSPTPQAGNIDRTHTAASAVHENGNPVSAARAKIIPIAPASAPINGAPTSATSRIPRS